ncbi:MAG: hypothetical protein JNN29_11135 [Chitinophagaceae bacterium]|nr:hypothetical protein [Chitinophagaceae bacterium]MBN8667536.1 hypothetical protein [Chitinophagales bacterium]
MKTTHSWLTGLFLSILLVSCTSRLDDSNNTSQVATSGSWRVTLFTDSGNDETTDFAGYTFTFNDNGTINAVKNGITQSGTWSVTSAKFNIDLGPKIDANKPLGELTDDWKILSTTNTEIRLGDDNASSNEFLTFTKN